MATVLDALKATFTPQGTAGRTSLLDTLISSQLSNRQNAMLRQRGMMGMAQGLLAASAPSTKPVSMGQALSTGITGMEQGRQSALNEMLIGSQITKNLTEDGDDLTDLTERKDAVRKYADKMGYELDEDSVTIVADTLGKGKTLELHEPSGTLVDTMNEQIKRLGKKKTRDTTIETEEEVTEEIPSGTGELIEFKINKEVEDLGTDWIKSGVDQILGSLEEIDNVVPPTGDIPGVGYYEGTFYDWMVGKDGRKVRQQLQRLFNIELAKRSGAAVTQNELDRLEEEFAKGGFKTEEELREGVQKYKNILKKYVNSILGTYTPEAKDRYLQQSQIDLSILDVVEEPDISDLLG